MGHMGHLLGHKDLGMGHSWDTHGTRMGHAKKYFLPMFFHHKFRR